MKIKINPFKANRASTMVAVCILAIIVGGALASYLLIVRQEASLGFRSQTWNTSLMVAEAGVEDALALVNKYENSPTGITNWANTAASQDNWTVVSNTAPLQVFSMTRQLGNVGSYQVYVNNVFPTTTNG